MALVRPCGPNMDALWPQQSNFLEYPILSSVLCLSVLCHKKADSFLRKYIFLKHGHWYFSRRNFITRCLQFPQKKENTNFKQHQLQRGGGERRRRRRRRQQQRGGGEQRRRRRQQQRGGGGGGGGQQRHKEGGGGQ